MKIISYKITYESSEKELISFVKLNLNKRVKGTYLNDCFTGIISGYCIKHLSPTLNKTVAISDVLFNDNKVPVVGWNPQNNNSIIILNKTTSIFLVTDVELI